jgi:preprotein translocase subunit SecE
MNSGNVETVSSKSGMAVVGLAVAIAMAGVLGFSFASGQPMLVRVGMLLAGLVVGIGVAALSEPGRRFLGFARASYEEARKVVWPSRKETLNMTGIVFVFVVVMAIFLFAVDKSLEWVLYDVLLRWK